MRLQPERASCGGRINTTLLPPCRFLATAMHFAMMSAAERYRELIANFAAKRPVLRKAQMVRI
jgi:hypothetical protein